MTICPSVSHCPSPRVISFRIAQLSLQKVNSQALMSDHQSTGSEFSTMTAAVHYCFHPDNVSVGQNSDCSPCGHVALTRYICIAGISGNFFTYSPQAAWAAIGIGTGPYGVFTSSKGL